MQRILVLGSTGPTGVLLAREALVAFEGVVVVLYVRTPGSCRCRGSRSITKDLDTRQAP